jgi:hypothetical protein
VVSPLLQLFLHELIISLLLYDYILGLLSSYHLFHESRIIEILDSLISLLSLKPIELVNISNQGRDDLSSSIVLSQKTTRSDLVSAAWAFLFDFAIVVFNAGGAELMQALLYVNWVFIDISANRAL